MHAFRRPDSRAARLTMASRAASAVASVLAFGVLAVVVAHWGWRWLAPSPEVIVHRPVDDVAAALGVAPPFGTAQAPAATGTAPASVAPGAARLLGVLAEPEGRGRALFRLSDGSARLAVVGEKLGSEGTLVAVTPEGVTLRGDGGERKLALRAPVPAGAPSAAAKSCVPAGFRGPVVRLNGELVSGLIQQPGSLAAVADAKDGALVVRDESGFAGMLGLRKGDRVTQANGIALRTPDDIVLAILRPLAASQSVRVTGSRGSEPHEFLVVNAAACR